MVSVKVCYKSSGKPVGRVGVSIGFSGLRGFSKKEFTSSDGTCHFDTDPGHGTVYVSGSSVYKGKISGMTVVYI